MSKLLIPALLFACSFAGAATPAGKPSEDLIARGRYLVMIGGCNDCHTPGFAASGGTVPQAAWLIGDRLGWQGAWGTTYAPNLRLRIAAMDLAAWKSFARTFATRPPMPYWAVNSMTDADLEALWTFVQSLGPAGAPAPAALPPGVAPQGPAVTFPAPPPDAIAGK
jgi:mono/diheme cytochrome c family protein